MAEQDRYQVGLDIIARVEKYCAEKKIPCKKMPLKPALWIFLSDNTSIQLCLFPSGSFFLVYNATHQNIASFEEIKKLLDELR